MAKTQQKETQTPTATTAPGSATPAVLDGPIAGVEDMGAEFDAYDDGLGEVGPSERKLAAKTWNKAGSDPNGDPYPPNVFYDTCTEDTRRTIPAVFLRMTKSRSYSTWNNVEKRHDTHCSSRDMITGRTSDGQARACSGCPYSEWSKDAEGKNVRHCAPCYNVLAAELDTQTPFLIRFRRTGQPPFVAHLQKHHIGRRTVRDPKTGHLRVANVPLWAFEVTLSLRMKGPKAVPVIERGEQLAPDVMRWAAEMAAAAASMIDAAVDRADADVDDHERPDGDIVDTSFEPSEFVGKPGQDFVGG